MRNSLSVMLLLASFTAILAGCSKQSASVAVDPTPSDVSTEQQPNVPAGWITSYEGALALAKAENRPVLVDFTGSDWCIWCKRMTKDTFSKPEFTSFAKDRLVLLYLDFPNSKPQTAALKEQNQKLQSQYRVRGFPTQVLLSPAGKILWQNSGYVRGGPDALISVIKKAEASIART